MRTEFTFIHTETMTWPRRHLLPCPSPPIAGDLPSHLFPFLLTQPQPTSPLGTPRQQPLSLLPTPLLSLYISDYLWLLLGSFLASPCWSMLLFNATPIPHTHFYGCAHQTLVTLSDSMSVSPPALWAPDGNGGLLFSFLPTGLNITFDLW